MDNTQPEVGRTQDTTLAILSHVGGLFTSWVAPLIIYLIKKDDADKFSAENAREALNFQITLLIVYVVGTILTVILIGALINLVAWLTCIVLSIMAALKVNEGVAYRYPFALRLIK